MYLHTGECKKFIHHLFKIYIYVYKYSVKNILNKYKQLKYQPFKYNIRTKYDILVQIMCVQYWNNIHMLHSFIVIYEYHPFILVMTFIIKKMDITVYVIKSIKTINPNSQYFGFSCS